jgi:HlyD family secretion protein
MKRLVRRWWLVPVALAVAAAVLVLRPDPIEIDTAAAQEGPMREVVREDGRTRVRDRYTVTAPITGGLQRIELREGTRVVRDEVVARIAPPPLDARTREQAQAVAAAADAVVRQARTRVTQAEASLATARHALERRRVLAAEGAIAAETVEQFALEATLREEELLGARAAEAAARADAAAARSALIGAAPGTGTVVAVRAPAAGRVLRVPDASARLVGAGEALLEIGETEALELVVPVLSEDAVRIRTGACVEITGWGGDSPLEGRVRQIEPSGFTEISALGIEEQRVNVLVEIGERPAAVGDGYRMDAAIVLWETERALRIPSSALMQRADSWTVFTVEDGRAALRTVQIGHRDGVFVEILAGLDAGDVVILFPSDLIAAGVRVRGRSP